MSQILCNNRPDGSTQHIIVSSRENIYANSTLFNGPFIWISIRDRNDSSVPSLPSGCIKSLYLDFDDSDDNNLMTYHQAMSVAKFYADFGHCNNLLINCEAGISRSSAVAAAILKYVSNDDSQVFNNAYFKPNRYVYRNVLKVLISQKG